MENDFFKDFGQKWKVRNGTVVLQITWYNASGKRCVVDRDGRQEDVKVFIKKRGGNGIEFTRLGGCTVDYL